MLSGRLWMVVIEGNRGYRGNIHATEFGAVCLGVGHEVENFCGDVSAGDVELGAAAEFWDDCVIQRQPWGSTADGIMRCDWPRNVGSNLGGRADKTCAVENGRDGRGTQSVSDRPGDLRDIPHLSELSSSVCILIVVTQMVMYKRICMQLPNLKNYNLVA